MKLLIGRFFGLLAVVLLALQPAAVKAQHGNAARLTVHRIANFGNGIAVILYVDGAQVMTMSRGREYRRSVVPGTACAYGHRRAERDDESHIPTGDRCPSRPDLFIHSEVDGHRRGAGS